MKGSLKRENPISLLTLWIPLKIADQSLMKTMKNMVRKQTKILKMKMNKKHKEHHESKDSKSGNKTNSHLLEQSNPSKYLTPDDNDVVKDLFVSNQTISGCAFFYMDSFPSLSNKYIPGSLVEYPGYPGTYWCFLCSSGPSVTDNKKISIGCGFCNTWAHKTCIGFQTYNNNVISEIEQTCLKCHPYIMIILFSVGRISKKELRVLDYIEKLFPMCSIIFDPINKKKKEKK